MIQRSLRNRKDKNIFKRIEIIIGQAQQPSRYYQLRAQSLSQFYY